MGEESGGRQRELGSSDEDELTGTRNSVRQCPEGRGHVCLLSHSIPLIQLWSCLKMTCLTNRKEGREGGMVEDGVQLNSQARICRESREMAVLETSATES